ncbi:MAG: radical SAM protein [Chloroflexota bacterium]
MITAKSTTDWAEVDDEGRLRLPPEVAARYGLTPGSKVRFDEGKNFVRLHRSVNHLAKVYIEPTDHCNIECVTCLRNAWDEKMGKMTLETFERIVAGLRELSPLPTVFFGGIGEPLFHPRTIEWIARIKKEVGTRVEMISNATLLTEERARQLIDSGLDQLWVSIDGATPESYADVRLGAELPKVIENLERFQRMRKPSHFPTPEIGIAFVAMKRNINDLPEVLKIGQRLKASNFSVSNVLPCTEPLKEEMLYTGTIRNLAYMMPSKWVPRLNLPKMDINDVTREAFYQALNSGYNVTFAGNNLGGAGDVCNFIESGSMSIGWDGGVSPCLPLLHTHYSYLHNKVRQSRKHVIGNVRLRSVSDLWEDPAYMAYRERVQSFAFAPCTFCGGCDLSEANEEDCMGNVFPACGGCLWAQGLIQCP